MLEVTLYVGGQMHRGPQSLNTSKRSSKMDSVTQKTYVLIYICQYIC